MRSCTLVVLFLEHVAGRFVGGFRGGRLVLALFVSDALWVVPVLTRPFTLHHVSGERGERREREEGRERGATERGRKVVMVCVCASVCVSVCDSACVCVCLCVSD